MPDAREWIDTAGVPVRSYGRWCPASVRHYIYALGVVWTLLRERRHYEVVYLLMGGVQLTTALPMARLLRKRILMKFSGSNTIAPLAKSWLGRLQLRLLRRWADRILILNSAMKEEAVAAGFSDSHLGWMPNPVDTEHFLPPSGRDRAAFRSARKILLAAPLILFVGRLAREKNLPSLMQAFASVVERQPEAVLALVGDGPLKTELEQLAKNLSIANNVRFVGAVLPTAVCGWLQAADVFVLVSSLEGFPCALIEAMATGLPAVVTNIPGSTQIIRDGVNGFVVPCGDSHAIAVAILRLVENSSVRRALGTAARTLIEDQYSISKVIARYERLLIEITRYASGPTTRRRAALR